MLQTLSITPDFEWAAFIYDENDDTVEVSGEDDADQYDFGNDNFISEDDEEDDTQPISLKPKSKPKRSRNGYKGRSPKHPMNRRRKKPKTHPMMKPPSAY